MSAKKLLKELQVAFSKVADPKRAKEQQRYMKSAMPYWGIGMPESRRIARAIFKAFVPGDNQEYRETLLYIFNNAKCREEWYAACDYAKKFTKYQLEENIDVYVELIKISQWWDIVDEVAAIFIGNALLGNKKLAFYLRKWIKDKNLWIRRTSLLTQLKYKENTDFDLLTELILKVAHEKEFFIRKAIGWVLREYSYTNPNGVKKFIKDYEDKLSTLSIREGLKAMKRVSVMR